MAAEQQPQGVERDYALARLTTIRTGGNAEFFARPSTIEQLQQLLQWAKQQGHEVSLVGSGSNLLVADCGVKGLVLKLDGELAGIEIDGTRMVCGGGMRLPSAAARAAREGLSGIEFGVSIPGTVGGAVRMNANAYGGELARVLEWVEVVTADAVMRRAPNQFDFAYRCSNLKSGEVVALASFELRQAEPHAVKHVLKDLRKKRHAAQPSGIKTFGSTFKNPTAPEAEGRTAGMLLEAAGCRGLEIGGARFSEKHANFVENMGSATTADVIAVMQAGRERVAAKFSIVLEPEVQTIGDVQWPAGWERH